MLFVRGDGVILVRTSHILGAANFKPLHAGFPAIEVMMFLSRTEADCSVAICVFLPVGTDKRRSRSVPYSQRAPGSAYFDVRVFSEI